MRLFIIAGEASGDLHGSNLTRQLFKESPNTSIHGWGGDLMKKSGVIILKHYRELAFMGFWEVAKNIGTVQKNFKLCKVQIKAYSPDAVILVDYPGFNLRMAKWIKGQGIKTIYYISPQVWAWKGSRVKHIKKYTDRMITILPFEPSWYQKKGLHVDYVGHPLIEAINSFQVNNDFIVQNKLGDQPIIALLPGSRKQEIEQVLPIYLGMVKKFSDYQFVIGAAPNIEASFYANLTRNVAVGIVYNQTYDLLYHCKAACVTSGTATLEAALFNVPQIVGYKGSALSYQIAKRVIKVKYIALVNLIVDQPIVQELIQADLNEVKLERALKEIVSPEGMIRIYASYKPLRNLLGDGRASEKAAKLIIEALSNNS